MRGVRREKWRRIVAGFLSVSYGIGAPLMAFLEFRDQVFSQRFDLPSELIYLTCAVQGMAAVGVLVRRFAPGSAAALTAITLGAVASHLRIGSPSTALPALGYTVLQVWFGLASRGPDRE